MDDVLDADEADGDIKITMITCNIVSISMNSNSCINMNRSIIMSINIVTRTNINPQWQTANREKKRSEHQAIMRSL